MTVDRSRAPAALPGAGTSGSGSSERTADTWLFEAEAARLDRIVLSERAQSLLAQGEVQACAIAGIEDVHRRVPVGAGQWIVLEGGIYGLGV